MIPDKTPAAPDHAASAPPHPASQGRRHLRLGLAFIAAVDLVSTTGTVYIKAYDADDDKTLSGDADDKVQSITKVMVNGKILVDGTKVETLAINNHPVTAILYNDGVVITGLNEGNTGDGAGGDDPVIKVYTANGFDRVELTNYSDQTAGGSNILAGKAFDIAPAGIEQGVSGKPVDFQLPVQIIDQDGDTTPIELIGVHLDAMPL